MSNTSTIQRGRVGRRARRVIASAVLPTMALLIGAAQPSTALAQYSKMVVLSDSMSDTHRYFDFTRATLGKGFP